MYSIAQLDTGEFILRHPKHPGLAWSHEAGDWVPLAGESGSNQFAVQKFATEDAADDYATENYLYPRRD